MKLQASNPNIVSREIGQVLVEFLVAGAITGLLVTSGASVLYFGWAKLWIRHSLYESLICAMKSRPVATCERHLTKELETFLPFGRLTEVYIRHNPTHTRGRVRLSISKDLWVLEGMTLKRGSGGFVHLAFLLPLVLTLSIGFYFLSVFLLHRAQQNQICRNVVLEANDIIEDGIENILSLNSEVRALQVERDGLDRAFRLAPPQMKPVIMAQIMVNQGLQLALKARQEAFKWAAVARAKIKMSTLIGLNSRVRDFRYSDPVLRLESDKTKHSVRKQSRGLGFERGHRINASWRYNMNDYDKKIFPLPREFNRELKISCASNIRKGNGDWYAQLVD